MPLALGVALCATLASPARMLADEGSNVTVAPSSLSFSSTSGGSAPPAQFVDLNASSGSRSTISVSTSSGGNWLSVTPSGSLTGKQRLRVSVTPGSLQSGEYKGSVRIATRQTTVKVEVSLAVARASGSTLSANPSSLTFSATVGGSTPAPRELTVSASSQTSFTARVTTQNGGSAWLTLSPSGSLTTNRTLAVAVRLSGLAAGTYTGAVALSSARGNLTIPVTLKLAPGGSSGGGGTLTSYTLVGWNDLGMHCQDGQDYSVFAVLPPYNTIHAHLISKANGLVTNNVGYTLTYEAVKDPLTSTLNTTSTAKTNFWKYAAALGFGSLAPDMGLKGFKMPGAANTPQAMAFSTADNTWVAEGIPIMPYADAPAAPYPVNYFPMMRLTAKDATGIVLATTDIVLPTSDEMDCASCHASNTGTAAARPAAGWINRSDAAKDVKLNILRKHDDRFKSLPLFQTAAAKVGYNPAGLEATVPATPILCYNCHASNALAKDGIAGIKPMTTAMHGMHASVTDPATSQTLDSNTSRQSCYRCHPGPQTECLRGAMGSLKTASGGNAIECQNCHGAMSNVAMPTRTNWLDQPNCQSCHTGTATSNAGQIVYNSVFSSGTNLRVVTDQTFATNPNTPLAATSLYRFSSGHGGLQCEACHGSTHAEYTSPIVNDNVQSNALQGHSGTLAECSTCHSTTPNTVTGGPHGLHPIGASWVNRHEDAARNRAACQACHGTDYRGTILSKMQADRTMAGRTFTKGTVIGCYSCHNGPSGD
ncbi:BACON domain-containing protein [Paludibaculum fermentans]|uniref:BACON domain-containing protein n=1 Tax=Paludibaculum fermentans TaxID=1473598 RepID=UPI003EB95FEC